VGEHHHHKKKQKIKKTMANSKQTKLKGITVCKSNNPTFANHQEAKLTLQYRKKVSAKA